ncbi:hypothetical protein ES702_07534 [subsurface metagenome]
MKKFLIGFLVFVLVLFMLPAVVHANPGYVFPSTNELNKAQQVPGREGQLAPYVDLVEASVGKVKLDFVGGWAGLAWFECRIDGVLVTSGTPHPVVVGDFIYPGGVGVNANDTVQIEISANKYVEVRLALGGERDWDFDWTRFDVLPPTKSDILINSGVPGKGLENAPGLDKPFNPKSQAGEHAGMK